MILLFVLWALLCALFIFIHHRAAIIAGFVIYGMHKGALEPVQKTFVSELSPEPFRASTLGAYQMAVGLCALPSSVIAGLLWDKINPTAPFYLSLALTMVAVIMMFFVKKKRLKEDEPRYSNGVRNARHLVDSFHSLIRLIQPSALEASY